MISMPFAAALAASVLSTSFISGVFGMAGGMILMSLLLSLMPLAPAMALHGITQIASNGARAWSWRRHIGWPVVWRYAVGATAAVTAVGLGLSAPSKPVALIFLGLATFIGLSLPARFTPNVMHPRQAMGCGMLCTALQLVCGVSGPMLDLFFVRAELGRKQIVATKAAIQTLGHFLKLGYFGHLLLSQSGEIVAPVAAVLAIAASLIGTQLSRSLLDALNDANFRSWSRWLIAAVATACLIQGIGLQLWSGDRLSASAG